MKHTRKIIHQGFLTITSISADIENKRSDTGFSTKTFEMAERNDCSSVLLHDGKGNVAILRQFRPAAIEHDDGALMCELAAGVIEKNENPHETALKECAEETGIDASKIELTPIGVYYLSPGGSNERTHMYLGKVDLSLIDTSAVHGLESECEVINVDIMTVDQALNLNEPMNITLKMALLELKFNS